jgi:hypothetical protein
MAVSATLKVKAVSLKRRFSVGTNPSRKMLIPEGSHQIMHNTPEKKI